jgi:integrase
VSLKLKKRGSAWQYTLCWRGHTYRQSSRHWSRDQAQEAGKKLLDDLHAESVGRKPARTFNQGVERYIADELPGMKPRTSEEALKNIGYIAPDLEGRYLTQAKEVAAAIRKRFAGKSPATINRRLQIVNRIVGLAFREWEWLDKPIPIPMLPEQHRERFLTRAEVERLAKAAGGANGDFIRLLAYTGIRKSQALSLTKAQVRGGYLHLGRDGKTGRPQLVPIHPRIRVIARKLPLSVTLGTLHKAWYRAVKETGVSARIHDLRHTLASWMLQSGADLIHVRDMLGHSSVAVTQRYAHLAAQHVRRAVNRI